MHEADSSTAKGSQFLRRFLPSQGRLYAYVLTLVPHRADAEDVLQDASVVMWEKFDAASPPNDFVAWGCRIAYFKVLDFYKKRGRSRVLFSQTVLERVAETVSEQAEALQLEERQRALADCIEKLRQRDRELLVCRLSQGATTRSTAERVGRSTDAVYKALAKIRQSLFECVTRSLAETRA